jgi:hypothetical protein
MTTAQKEVPLTYVGTADLQRKLAAINQGNINGRNAVNNF